MALNLRSLKHFGTRLFSRFGRTLLRDHYIFVHKDLSKLDTSTVAPGKIVTYQRAEDLTAQQWSDLKTLLGAGYEDVARDHFARGCRFYVLEIDGQIASLGWVISGRDLQKWWHPITPEDFVMFSAYTAPAFRGQRLWGKIIAAAYRTEIENGGGQYYCDCNMANIASRKQLLRSGFEIIAREKRLNPLR